MSTKTSRVVRLSPVSEPEVVKPQSPYPLAVGLKEAGEMVCLHRSYLWKLVMRGEIPSIRTGKRILIMVEDLKAWLLSQRQAS